MVNGGSFHALNKACALRLSYQRNGNCQGVTGSPSWVPMASVTGHTH
jgi:hypothetical protein